MNKFVAVTFRLAFILFKMKIESQTQYNSNRSEVKQKSAGSRENQTSWEKWKNSVLWVAKISLCKLLVQLHQSVMKENLLILN